MQIKESEWIATMPETLDDLRSSFGQLLGLDEAVPETVLRHALADPLYAHHLILCKDTPIFLQQLYHEALQAEQSPVDLVDELSTPELLGKAAKALWSWSKTGFALVDNNTYQARLEACLECPHLVDPPKSLVYKIATIKNADGKICKLCGCLVSNKARLPSEDCPDSHPIRPNMSRWGGVGQRK